MSITTRTDADTRLHVVLDDEHTTPADRYTIWFEGRDSVVIAQPFESPDAVWQRVLGAVANMREVVLRGILEGRGHYFATVYVGIEPTKQQKQEHMRDWITFCLYQLADPGQNKDGNSRVQALVALSKLHGLNRSQTVYLQLPTLEELNASIAQDMAPH
jgi:hypothetical protein